MFRFYVSPESIDGEFITIDNADINHIKNVLRMKISEHIIVCDGCGHDIECELTKIEMDEVIAKIISREDSKAELDANITLYQGLPKKDKMELIIQKAVELGANRIVPVDTSHCVVKIDNKKEEKVINRWQQIAHAAAKQSQRGIIPKVSSVIKFSKALSEAKNMDAAIIPYEKAQGIEYSRKCIEELKGKREIAIFIGPEGGFSKEEIEEALSCGVQPITLGHRILRTETAGLTALSIIMFEIEKDGVE